MDGNQLINESPTEITLSEGIIGLPDGLQLRYSQSKAMVLACIEYHGETYLLPNIDGEYVIGRKSGNFITTPDTNDIEKSVSREHMKLIVSQGRVYLQDKSSYGIYENGQKIYDPKIKFYSISQGKHINHFSFPG